MANRNHCCDENQIFEKDTKVNRWMFDGCVDGNVKKLDNLAGEKFSPWRKEAKEATEASKNED
jgi:hypothetical protein